MNLPPPLTMKLNTGNVCRVIFEARGHNVTADLRWRIEPTAEERAPVEAIVCKILTHRIGVAPQSIASTSHGTDAAAAAACKRRFLYADDN